MIGKEIPSGATHCVVANGKASYLMRVNGEWMVYYNYDCYSGWGFARKESISCIEEILK